MIVTLAGHVDHGKTSLVKALSGIDTDRLKEEKRRGLTIDLGFAYIKSEDTDIGFVDVPGHHKFIHNMVAGVATTQFALLVVAADDGPMPQTREHLNILSLLGLQNGIVVITKTDKVSDDRLAQCQGEVNKLIESTFLCKAAIVPVSTQTGEGVADVLKCITEEAQNPHRYKTEKTQDYCFRMAVDRSFTIKGSGLVVTGTIHSGSIDLDSPLLHSATGQSLRLRSINKQNQQTTCASKGDRCSLNISGLEKAQVNRGDWILDPLAYTPSESLVVQLTVLADFPRAVKHWLPVHIYHATSHTTGKIALLDSAPLQPGESAMVELVLDETLFAKHGDRLVLREFGAERTLGGGKVIDNSKSPYRRRNRRRLQHLNQLDSSSPELALTQMLDTELNPGGEYKLVNLDQFQSNWNLQNANMESLLIDHSARVLTEHSVKFAYHKDRETALASEALKLLADHHHKSPDSTGMQQSSIRKLLHASEPLLALVLSKLEAEGKIKISSGLVHLPEHNNALPTKVQALFDAYCSVAKNRDQPPSLGDAAKQLRAPQAELARALKQAARAGMIREVSTNRFFLPDQLATMVQHVLDLTVNNAAFTVREYRDITGIGRNTAIEVLEHFDARGFTKRVENTRIRTGHYK